MKKVITPVLLILGIILAVVLVIFAVREMMSSKEIPANPPVTVSEVPGRTNEPTSTPDNTPTGTPESTPTAVPENTPTQSPENTPTSTPEVTPTPVPQTGPEGSFKSDTGTSLNVRTDWKYEEKNNGKYHVTVSVYLECYTLNVSQKKDSVLKINDKSIQFSTDAYSFTERVFHEPLLYEYEFEAEKGETFDISAKWYFRGTYSKIKIECIEATGSFIIL